MPNRRPRKSLGDKISRRQPEPRSTVVGAVVGAALIALLGIASAGLIAPHLEITNHPVLIAAALAPYLVYAAALAVPVAVAWVTCRWLPTLAVLGLAVSALIAQLTIRPHDGDTSAQAQLRIVTANLGMGEADAEALMANLRRERPDVVALQELTPDAVHTLDAAGLTADFPYHVGHPLTDAAGAGLWSRYPIAESTLVPGFEMVFISARISMPAAADPRILVPHIAGPWPQPIDTWRRDMASMDATMRSLAVEPDESPILIAGDFNATVSMRPFRRLLENGATDAATETGGTIRTYRQGSVVPPVLGIDHVLLRNCRALAASAIPLPGSDHRGLLVDVSITHSPGP